MTKRFVACGALFGAAVLFGGSLAASAQDDANATFLTGGERIRDWKVDAKGWWHARLPAGTKCSHFFVNGVRRQRPYLPRKGYYFLGEPPAGAEKSPVQLMSVRPGQIPEGTDWTDAEICVFHIWTMSRLPITSFDPATRVVTTPRERAKESYFSFTKWQWYRLDNVRTALGEPGDWYLDRTGELVYVPCPGESPATAECWAAVRPHALVIDGVTNRVIRGVTFAYSGWDMPEKGQTFAQAGANATAAVLVTRSKNVRFENCTFEHTGGYALEFGAGAVDCAAVNCTFRDLGAGGVKIGSEWSGAKKPETWAHGCRVEDCLLEHGGRFEPAGVGIWIGNADGSRIVRNTVRDFYYTGISVGWTWRSVPNAAHHNYVGFNDISAIGQRRLSDMGGIYTLGDQPGTVVEGNLVRDVTNARGYGHGIYLDEGSSHMTVVSNYVEAAEGVAFYLQFGTVSNEIVGNTFLGGEETVLRHSDFTPANVPTRPSRFVGNTIWWDDPDCSFSFPSPASSEYLDSHDNVACLAGSRLEFKTLGTARKTFAKPVPPAGRGCSRKPEAQYMVPDVFDPAPVHVLGDRPGALLTNGTAKAVFDAKGRLASLSDDGGERLLAPVPFVELKLKDGRILHPVALRNEDDVYLNFIFEGGECWFHEKPVEKRWEIKTLKLSVPDVAELRVYTGSDQPRAVYEREFGFLRKISKLSLPRLNAREAALDRAAVVFDRPNGPACLKTNILWNDSVETNRFTTGRPEWVMPFGAGDLSAMASFGEDALEIHLSQASWLAPKPKSMTDRDPQFRSPGHVQIRFANLKAADFTRYALTMDIRRGRLLLDAATPAGTIRAEMFGDRASGALVVDVADGRAGVAAPAVTVERKLETLTVLDAGRPVVGPYRPKTGSFTLAIGATAEAARRTASARVADLTAARDAWWRDFWSRGWVSLEGDADAALLEKSWYVNLYQYANVGYAKMPPKFNGGPGIVYDDMRCWGRDVWWQNTRELIWPMCAAGHADFAKRYLEFYSDCLANLRLTAYPELKPHAGATVLNETMSLLLSPLYAMTNLPSYDVKAPYRLPTAAERAEATRVRKGRPAAHTTHVFSSGTELLQQMIDYVRFTGDTAFLPRVAAWLRAQTEVYLLLLEEEKDGKFHIHGTNVNESWFVVDDSIVDLAAARLCLSWTISHGAAFGYPATLVDAAKDRLGRLADSPRGRPYVDYYNKKTGLKFAEGENVYHPCTLAPGMRKQNSEMNELYLVHPFAMREACGTEAGRALMRGVFPAALALAANQYGGGAGWGWLPIGVAAARFGHPDAAVLVADHARRTCRWPYGGGKSPGAMLYRGAIVENTVYMDGSGVVQTGVQELLLQSHADEPSAEFLEGGPVRLLPAGVPKAWKGAFRLQARGGFTVEVSFADGRVTRAEATSARGGVFSWIDPATGAVRTRPTRAGESFVFVRPRPIRSARDPRAHNPIVRDNVTLP